MDVYDEAEIKERYRLTREMIRLYIMKSTKILIQKLRGIKLSQLLISYAVLFATMLVVHFYMSWGMESEFTDPLLVI